MTRHQFRAIIFMAVLALLCGVGAFLPNAMSSRAALPPTTITIDGHSAGRTFDGVGGLSGGGGTSRLLIDYPQQQQNEILDYLFKPNYGASLHILKVEIGSDANSTNGAEASHERTATDRNYNRGYEWWLMEQAKLRNPNIKLFGLEWGAPGWFQISPDIDPKQHFWSHDNIQYIVDWLKNAESVHHLHIDYIGGWNERGYNKVWFEDLRSALKSNGLTTQIVAADGCCGPNAWSVATDMKNDPTFNSAIDIIGGHYPGYVSTTDAQSLGKPIWASENGSKNYDSGASRIAQALNRDYLEGKMTADINWTVIASWYKNLPYAGDGLMLADQPWSGYYYVAKSIWAMAHTAQFTQPGWQYLDGSSGYLGGTSNYGSYVSLKSPNNSDYSTIIENQGNQPVQTANFSVVNGLSTGTVHVWASNFNSSNPGDWFVRQADITPVGGKYALTIQPGYVYSLTTTSGQGKGMTTPPAPADLKLPYADNFESYHNGQLPRYLSDLEGGFEAATCSNGHTGECLQQQVNIAPIPWATGHTPVTIIGNSTQTNNVNWSNYKVSVDTQLLEAGHTRLIGRLDYQPQTTEPNAYILDVQDTGAWTLLYHNYNATTKVETNTTLKAGTVSFGLNKWHTLALAFSGTNIQASIDTAVVANVNDTGYSSGSIGLGTLFNQAQFDNLSIQPLTGSNVTTIDDSVRGTGLNQWNYTGSWGHCTNCGSTLYNGSNSWDKVTNDTVTLTFSGTLLKFYGVVDPRHGIGAVSIDGGAETTIDFYAATRAGDQLLWTSPTLVAGTHTFKLRVTGTKNASSSDYFVAADRVDVS